ncbi:MAG: hypothetical protein P8I94_00650 [Emcibacteraceae bacterium]|nr:hypothetical protein [Emcibacteraceae bacterium]
MTTFLKQSEEYSEIEPAIEMADFEWTFNDVFDAPDKKSTTFEEVAQIPPEAWTTLRIHLQPSYRVHEFNWNTPAVWSAVNKELDEPVMPKQYPQMSHCIQWKSDMKCFFRTLSDEEADVLELVSRNLSFPDICQSLIEAYGDQAPLRATELFKGWLQEGLVADLEYLKT